MSAVCLSLRSATFSTHRDFQVCEGDSYSCKWFSPLSKVEVVETDYHNDIWDYIVARGQRSNVSHLLSQSKCIVILTNECTYSPCSTT